MSEEGNVDAIRAAFAYWSESSIGSEEERVEHDKGLAALDALVAERDRLAELLDEATGPRLEQLVIPSRRDVIEMNKSLRAERDRAVTALERIGRIQPHNQPGNTAGQNARAFRIVQDIARAALAGAGS